MQTFPPNVLITHSPPNIPALLMVDHAVSFNQLSLHIYHCINGKRSPSSLIDRWLIDRWLILMGWSLIDRWLIVEWLIVEWLIVECLIVEWLIVECLIVVCLGVDSGLSRCWLWVESVLALSWVKWGRAIPHRLDPIISSERSQEGVQPPHGVAGQ